MRASVETLASTTPTRAPATSLTHVEGMQRAYGKAVALAVAAMTAALLTTPAPTDAQVRGSERAQIQQVADGTTITMDYGRPHLRGRSPVFGNLVGWGHTWTPGANQATTFEADKDVTLNGEAVPAGRYSVWMVPSPDADWEVVLDPDAGLWHTRPPGSNSDQIRFTVTPEQSEPTEALTWDFPMVKRTGMLLRFRWDAVTIPMEVVVQPSRVLNVEPEDARALVGSYRMSMEGPPPPGTPAGAVPPEMGVVLRFEGDRLLGVIEGAPPNLPTEFALLPVADLVFNPAWIMDGEVFETEVDMYFEFNVEDGAATGFDVRGLEDRLMMRGQRVN